MTFIDRYEHQLVEAGRKQMTDWSLIREPDDRMAETRISLGSTPKQQGIYLVFRGEPDKVIDVLEQALEKAKQDLPQGKYQDRRGRPQG